ncbi:MAG: hypothetical protein HWD62_17965 [Cyclobacteriaceae bacterium]|nr:MAG: hypothetical protein HWD62_17965 [Cyclobacteriaceae bacterium]
MAGNAKFTQNAAGYVRLKATYTGMNSAIRYADVLQYSNDFSSKTNKVHFTITKQGNKVRGYVDGKEIIALDKNRVLFRDLMNSPNPPVLLLFILKISATKRSGGLCVQYKNQ